MSADDGVRAPDHFKALLAGPDSPDAIAIRAMLAAQASAAAMASAEDQAREARCRARCEAAGVTLNRAGGGYSVGRWGLARDLAGLAELEAWVAAWLK